MLRGFHAVCNIDTMPRLVQIETCFFGIIGHILTFRTRTYYSHYDIIEVRISLDKNAGGVERLSYLIYITMKVSLCVCVRPFFSLVRPSVCSSMRKAKKEKSRKATYFLTRFFLHLARIVQNFYKSEKVEN